MLTFVPGALRPIADHRRRRRPPRSGHLRHRTSPETGLGTRRTGSPLIPFWRRLCEYRGKAAPAAAFGAIRPGSLSGMGGKRSCVRGTEYGCRHPIRAMLAESN
jgi:hypothetical protein